MEVVVEVGEVVGAGVEEVVVAVVVVQQHENNMPEGNLDNSGSDRLLGNGEALAEEGVAGVEVVVVEGQQRPEDSRLLDIARYIVLHSQEDKLFVAVVLL